MSVSGREPSADDSTWRFQKAAVTAPRGEKGGAHPAGEKEAGESCRLLRVCRNSGMPPVLLSPSRTISGDAFLIISL